MSDHPFSVHRLQTDQEPGPLPQAGWVLDDYSGCPAETEDSFSCTGKCPGGKDFLLGWGGHQTVLTGRSDLPTQVLLLTMRHQPANFTLSFCPARLNPELVRPIQERFEVRGGKWPVGALFIQCSGPGVTESLRP